MPTASQTGLPNVNVETLSFSDDRQSVNPMGSLMGSLKPKKWRLECKGPNTCKQFLKVKKSVHTSISIPSDWLGMPGEKCLVMGKD